MSRFSPKRVTLYNVFHIYPFTVHTPMAEETMLVQFSVLLTIVIERLLVGIAFGNHDSHNNVLVTRERKNTCVFHVG